MNNIEHASPDAILNEIAGIDFDLEGFAALAVEDAGFRRLVVNGMLAHPHIMVYYNCFYIIERICRRAPDLVYPYWDGIAGLLSHRNSYHRNFALTLLADMVTVDREGKFNGVFQEYLGRLDDDKFMTCHCCARNLRKIAAGHPDLTLPILTALMEYGTCYTRGQSALLKYEVLEFIESVRGGLADTAPADAFILTSLDSPSPKTRKKAGELARRLSLEPPPAGGPCAGMAEQ